MDRVGNRQEHTTPRNERLSRDESAIVDQVTRIGDLSLNVMYPQMVRLQPQSNPEYQQTQAYQPFDDGRQYQVAPIVGASAAQTQTGYETVQTAPPYPQTLEEQAHFETWEQEVANGVSTASATMNLQEPDAAYTVPEYLDDTIATDDMVAEARQKVIEAHRNDPHARPEGVN
jgi:hypothetical protein